MSALNIEDRYPLISQRGNLSGKASQWVSSLIGGDWWTASPTTGNVPDTVERNRQFYINQGPVDMEIFNAQETHTPSSMGTDTLVGTYLPKRPMTRPLPPQEEQKQSWYEMFIYHVFKEPTQLEFSTNPTRY